MVRPLTATALAAVAGVRHGFFTREGGVSRGIYASLNCGLGSGDQRADVEENRRRVAAHLGTQAQRLITCHQVHSPDVVTVDAPWDGDHRPKADGMVTRVPGIALGALAADCAPILFADADGQVVGAAHAGWKGALGGVGEATVAAMERLGADRRRISAVVGPCIGREAYEVGPEFEARFIGSEPSYAGYFARPAGAERSRFDLPRFVVDRLRAAGVGTVEMLDRCTYSDGDRFFSYRRTTHCKEADYGRQISAIMIA